ncbi:MAG: plastocyanin/azurin family copper-binding protein [Thermoproteota archaeon]|nr:plastocyanin/azurin family copper-binding protein [Thermoproteota archaeon]
MDLLDRKKDNHKENKEKKDRIKLLAIIPMAGAIVTAAILLSGLSLIGSFQQPAIAQEENMTGAAGNATNATMTGAAGNATNATMTGAAGGPTTVSIVPGSSSLTTDAYQPNPAQVSTGATITWTNDDSVPHTATSGENSTPDGTFDSGIMAPAATFEHTFAEAGEYPYFCLLHPNMVGTVSVS